ncbi:dienelactone hydrolase family protein [Antrihabitans sp. YC2-6]|uniref:dienelactone hydrolase family protein n=1 Tax=Antrihabitans sp. YC2-6 TaxID=2799498 RepID=UPI0018F33BB0|nr:dienelactone hydrolase family protein [Antrihabitans sp. YC2-6]MBJ8343450.1 dienelactone hydrolase family protein [Antrihabitans sp. YC2-6]
MTPLQRYVAEEIATDHADGLLPRREALRRLGLLGLTAAAASTLLAACASNKSESGTTTIGATASTTPPPGLEGAVATEPITFEGPSGKLTGAWAAAADPRGVLLVIHENKGLTDHIRSVAGRFAGAGYSALAIDLLSEEGGTGSFDDPAKATAALTAAPPERLLGDMKAGIDEMQRRAPGKKVGAIGFCMGGMLTWRLLASGEPRLDAAAPFYGPLPEGASFAGSHAAVIAMYGELDERVNATRDAATTALEVAGLPHEVVTERGANHAFFNDTSDRYDPTAAADAWQRVLAWFGQYLG